MTGDKRGLDAQRFDRFRPDLDAVTCLDLNFQHFFSDDPRNFGLTYLYSIGHTGHEYIAACTIPGVAPQRYPIAYVDEEGYEVDVFASSIGSWLPCYLLRTAQRLRADEVDAFLAEEPAMRVAVGAFGPAADRLLTAIVAHLRDGAALLPSERHAEVEPGGYVAEYLTRAAAGQPMEPLIDGCPWYNRPLYHRLGRPRPPADLAVELFRRRLVHDASSTSLAEAVPAAARLAAGHTEAAFTPLIGDLAEHGLDNPGFWVGNAFFEAGRRVEAAGGPQALPLALTCYENAVHQHAAETEEPHPEAFARIAELVPRLGDEDYSYYLAEAFTYIPVE
jgi:hypothetical protein